MVLDKTPDAINSIIKTINPVHQAYSKQNKNFNKYFLSLKLDVLNVVKTLNRLQKKYAGKTDQESMMKQNQEMLAIYQKYKINPMAGCLFALIQLPIFIAFFEAIQRTPVIFEDKFLGLQLGTTPAVGIGTSTFYAYIILILIIAGTTFFSFKLNATGNMEDPTMKMMPTMMTGMILVTGIFMPTGLGIYWVTSNLFTIVQNILIKRSKSLNGKA